MAIVPSQGQDETDAYRKVPLETVVKLLIFRKLTEVEFSKEINKIS